MPAPTRTRAVAGSPGRRAGDNLVPAAHRQVPGPEEVGALRGRRRGGAFVGALPDVLERVAGELRAGAAPLVALAEAAGGADLPRALAADLGRIVDRAADAGARAGAGAWAEERPLPPVAAAAAALEVAVGAGGPAAAGAGGSGHRPARPARRRRRGRRPVRPGPDVGDRGRRRPVVSLALSLLADRRVAPTLVGSAPGRACLLAGVALEGLAALWMRRIVRCAA